MSLIPYDNLKPVNDPTIKTYPYTLDLDTQTLVKWDSVTKLAAYWHKALIRNYGRLAISYRFAPGENFSTIPSMTERIVNGWGSYIELKTTALPEIGMVGVVEFELTPISEAIQ